MISIPSDEKWLRILSGLFFTVILILLLSCEEDKTIVNIHPKPLIPAPEQTDDGWETASLKDVGIQETPILDMVNYLNLQPDHNVHSILLVKEGKLVFEAYFKGHAYFYYGPDFHGETVVYDRETLQCTHSVTKSITSVCIGICRDLGWLQSADEKVFSFFPQYTGLSSPEKDQITVKHLLTMSSGLEWNERDVGMDDPENDLIQMVMANDPLAYVLGKPLVDPPGTKFYYNGGNTNVLGEIVRKCSGSRLDWISEMYLFTPLGITEFQWQFFPNGVVYASGDVYLRPRDMAKIGYLYLNKGIWKEERILSEEWITESIQPHISISGTPWPIRYGYQWWIDIYHLLTPNATNYHIPIYYASGWGGQRIAVFPTLEMVAIFTGSNYVTSSPNNHLITEYILPAVLYE